MEGVEVHNGNRNEVNESGENESDAVARCCLGGGEAEGRKGAELR